VSRSRRKTPIRGACGHTEKWDKIFWHRRMRLKEREAIVTGKEMPLVHEVSDPYAFNKDGKIYYGKLDPKLYDAEFMRKLLKK